MTIKCYNHPENYAIRTCHYCGRYLCSQCVVKGEEGYYYCKDQSDCLTYQEKEIDINSSKSEGEIKKVEIAKEVSIEETDRPDQLSHQVAKQKSESSYLNLVRKPGFLRDAVVMAEILNRPRFRRR